ncbi:Na+/H+ antiporter NhaC family protein [Halobacillus karajensis]|uniref:Malate-2H(+)/Na(+)-lactate antiporter n=1 Tax=Halobacillus karajensis TaxID=195088 RepID=A0A024P6N2_9BACI|nr:Na+/H+ antiporter NhaC family protein [Halobacillus karajensis]CDQ20519.1 Malate-2H(+)/Na(+)-lactate antiporter [Halobacillus karajensis]CDQ24012.1 Malate-2H(+)/Na(+)-lactate antiporter [Halobacillus karajensis]CDQ27490.1 Malate-2H(+)/Na(+)-lactate antiporter [Halobacillus karajensis]
MADNEKGKEQEQVIEEALGEKDIRKLEFRGGVFTATIPLVFFIIWAIVLSVTGLVTEQALVLGMVIGIALGLFFCKSKWADYAQSLISGMAQPVGVVAIIAWFWAGMFANMLSAGGLVDGLIWFGFQSGLEGGAFVGITFLLAGLFSTAVGTGYGTVATFGVLMYPAGVILGADPVILLAAILSGAVFGDNLAPVSDTTIVSATTQDADVPGVVRSRFKYSIAAAIPALILFVIFGGGGESGSQQVVAQLQNEVSPDGLLMLAPFILVLYLALSGHHLLTSLSYGILASVVFIFLSGKSLRDVLHIHKNDAGDAVIEGALIDGISGYFNMAILILFILAAAYLLEVAGTMDVIKNFFLRIINNVVRRAELSIFGIVAFLNMFITINTAAEIAAAPFVRKIGEEMKIHSYRRANLLDTVTSSLGYIFPWSGGVLLAWATVQGAAEQYDFLPVVGPAEVFPFVFQGWLLLVVMFVAAWTGWGLRYTGKNGEEVKPADFEK